MRRFGPLAAIFGAFGLIIASARVSAAGQRVNTDSPRDVLQVTPHEVSDLRVAVEMAFASRSPGVWIVRQQDTTSKKQDTTKKATGKKSTPPGKASSKAAPTPPVVLPAKSLDTSITNQEARRKQFVLDSTRDADRRVQDSLTIEALKKTTADAVSKSESAIHRQTILDDSLKRLQKSPPAPATSSSVRNGPRSSSRVPISKEAPAVPPKAAPVIKTPPTIIVHDTTHDTTVVKKTDTLQVPGPTVFKTDTLKSTKTDTTTKIVVVKSGGHNPWPWIFGMAVVGGATTYLICQNHNNCRSPRSSSCAINVVNPTNGQIPSCPASSKSRGVGMSWGFQF